MNVPIAELEKFAAACHKVADFGLVACSSGNMSQRLEDGSILLTASGAWLGEITAEQIVICCADGCVLNNVKPTVEKRFHLGVLQQRSDMNVVLHFQSPYATAIACGNCDNLDFNVIIEVPFYIGKPAVLEYLSPGSEELADSVIEAAAQYDMVILKNHGQVTVGKDINDAIQRACFFELACQILLTGKDVKALKAGDVESLRKIRKV